MLPRPHLSAPLSCSLALIAAVVAPSPARAQDGPEPSMDSQRFVLAGSYHNFVLVPDGQILPAKRFGFDVALDFAYLPIQKATSDLRRQEGVIDALFSGHLRAGFAFTDWVELNIALAFMQFAATAPGIADIGGNEAAVFSLGDMWIDGRFRLLKEEKHPLSLVVIPFLTLPTGARGLFLTSGVPTFGARVAVSRAWRRFHFAGHFGYRIKPGFARVADNVAADDEILYGVGLGVTPVVDKLDVNLELVGAGIVGPGLAEVGGFSGRGITHSPLELLIDARIKLGKGFSIMAGGGPGITAGVGAPAFRVFGGLSWAPGRDRDKDGLADAKDGCPDEPEDKDEFQDEDGCPDPDNDGDGIADVDDKCPNDAEDKDNFEDVDGCPDPDNDQDGLADKQDSCPDEPEDKDGYQDADGCPDADNDGDGIEDQADACPMDPEDVDGFQDSDGCPEPDNDGDGILDGKDLCPLEPENKNGVKDEDGCPDETMAVVTGDKIMILEKVLFVFGKDEILKRSFPILDAVKKTLLDHPEISKIRIEGHTDDKGKDADNQKLSEKRANAILRYLVKAGLDPERLVAVGYGESRPLVPNDSEDNRERNRRVEFTILESGGGTAPPKPAVPMPR